MRGLFAVVVWSVISLATCMGTWSSVHAQITSLCGAGECQTRVRVGNETCTSGAEAACMCVPSRLGVPCVECGKQGYIENGICVCNLNNQDPTVQCVVPFASNSTINTTRIATVANVTCFFNEKLGWLKTEGDQSDFMYGRETDPPVCDACWNDAIGPVPGVLVDDPVLGPLQTCTTFGGPDPNAVNDTSFRTCSGHGDFDFAKTRCNCTEPFLLFVTEFDNPQVSGAKIPTCSDCSPLWGPREGPSRCTYVAVPDPLTGQNAVCGGHGTFANGQCNCYTNSTFGFWNLSTITLNATVPVYRFPLTAETELVERQFSELACTECQPGYELSKGCRA